MENSISHGKHNPEPHEINSLILLFNQGNLTEAADQARAMTSRFPHYGPCWKALGVALKMMGKSADALASFQKAALLTPEDLEAHYNFGICLQDVGRLEEAASSFRNALCIDPACAIAQKSLDAIQKEIAQNSNHPTNPYRLIDGRHGRFLVNPHDFYLGRAMIMYGEYGEIEWQILDALLGGKDAIEVGANIGTHTISMAKKLASMGRRLLAIEPQPVVFQNMCANLALNGLFNVLAENAACSDKQGWLTFEAPNYEQDNNSGGVSMREDGSGSQRVRSARLDELVPPGFDVGLIKIDVEGFEQKVLEGATGTIAQNRPMLYLENDRIEKSKALIEWLWTAGYKLWWHIPPLFNPNNFAGKCENIYGNTASFNMLALPEESGITANGLPLIEDSNFHPLKTR